jgi:DDE superfamily endonuclease/IstB-like ATP binding protein
MRQSTKTTFIEPGALVLFYRAALPLSRQTLNYVAGLIRRHRKSIGSRWRKLNPGQQALLVLACRRKGETFADLAAGFAVGTTTAWRYAEETTALLADRAPRLRRAVREAKKAGLAYVVLDGTLIPIDRVVAIASNESFSGWTKTFTDPRLCAAIVDRLTFNAAIIETGTESYRLARARASQDA